MKQHVPALAARFAAATVLFSSFIVAPQLASAGDAFLRGGVIFEPRDLGIEGRWRADFGSDYPVNFSETIYVGFEIQTSVYRQDVEGTDDTATLFPANGFVNVKYKSGNIGVRPFGGGGIGLISTFRLLSGNNGWDTDMGFHLLGGIEVGMLSVELQLQRAFASDAEMNYAIYAGFVW